MHCQNVSSFGNAPVKMCRRWAGGLVCVCSSFYLYPKCIVKMCSLSAMHLSRCVIFGQGALCVCACVCVLSFYFCPKYIVKMCCLSAMHLSRCVVFGQGALCVCACVCVLSFYFCPKCTIKVYMTITSCNQLSLILLCICSQSVCPISTTHTMNLYGSIENMHSIDRCTLPPHPLGTLELAVGSDRSTLQPLVATVAGPPGAP